MIKKLVYGGRRDGLSNRMVQDATMLPEVKEEVVEEYFKAIQKAATRKQLAEVLIHMNDNNINIVGTRDYVYSSISMATEVMHFHPSTCQVITRSMNLRNKVFELWNAGE